jgi:hypothetical protein
LGQLLKGFIGLLECVDLLARPEDKPDRHDFLYLALED